MIIYARNCTVRAIESEEAFAFVNDNHRSKVSQTVKNVSVGLFHENELVAVAMFSLPRTSAKKKQYTCELYRLAFKKNTRIVGGASKLISHYKKQHSPADIFTYQDMAGEQTDVYAHCGMTLVSQDKRKQYLVAPGKTLQTAERREYFSMAEVSRRGPDALLKTNLGERWVGGRRKTNPELFIEDLGWHVEETAGDRVWEWIDAQRTYYVYKITAADSDKYYYGVSHVKIANATLQDCLAHKYMGSGGAKFKNWKTKHSATLNKEIIKIFSMKAPAYAFEEMLVENSWKTDDDCLNSISEGFVDNWLIKKCIASTIFSKKNCSVHSLVSHRNDSCDVCASLKRVSTDQCEIHGEQKFLVKRVTLAFTKKQTLLKRV